MMLSIPLMPAPGAYLPGRIHIARAGLGAVAFKTCATSSMRGRDGEVNEIKREQVRCLRADLEKRLLQLESADVDAEEAHLSSKHWEDLTSANSQAGITKLQCDIDVDKEIRHDFMKYTPEDILDVIHDYLNYCAQNVFVIQAVFSKVLPVERCSSSSSLVFL
ncbi:hypothetical protein AZE42_07923 [Rhizopogon vesiculosus]|uniref:DNA mitochondrial polymerase exonuclease domain-containing protein n=1 Tax=Rhizopogon vesiculosus TaxID=180088 RepID=A0A1J8QJ75_9AGAM|nr:hypothetical protein AZE42_07923 [Rhizopogon vesiculosus]